MKKCKILLITVLLLIIPIVLVGCGKKEEKIDDNKDRKKNTTTMYLNKDVIGYIGKTSEEMLGIFGGYESHGGYRGAEWFGYGEYSVAFSDTVSEIPSGEVIAIYAYITDVIKGMRNALSIDELNELFGSTGKVGQGEEEAGDDLQYYVEYVLDDATVIIWLGQNKKSAEINRYVYITETY